MEYLEIIHLLDGTTNQPSKFRTRNWVKINEEARETQNANSDIKFKTSMKRSNLCDYSDTYIHVKATVTVPNTAAAATPVNDTNKKVIFKNCAPFTNRISETNNEQVDDAQDTDVVILMYNLIEYSDVYLNTSGSLWRYFKDEQALDNSNNFLANNNTIIIIRRKIVKQQITGQTGNSNAKDVEMMVPLKYLSNFWRTLEMPLINCENNLQLKWSKK